jgi:hypothetical protein
VSLAGTAAGAPAFPTSLSDASGVQLPPQTISTVSPDFKTMRTFQNNVQIDRALGADYSVQAGVVYVKGYDLPAVINTNLINPIGQLSNGVPIFGATPSAATRRDPRFNHINEVQSIGSSTYRALTVQLSKRFSRGIQFDLSYAIGKGEDNAPLTSALAVQGDDGVSDPTDLDRDKGPNIMDQRHTFAASIVATPSVTMASDWANTLLNNNQIALMLMFNSGLPQNIRSNRDLNNDGVLADRPIGVSRNPVYLPARYNVDLRYSRYIPFGGSVRAEVLAEFKNLFNTSQTASYGNLRVIATDAMGVATVPIPESPDEFSTVGRTGYESRQFQIGFKFFF